MSEDKTGYRIERIALVKSDFERAYVVSKPTAPGIESKTEIQVLEGKINAQNKFTVGLNVKHSRIKKGSKIPEVKIDVTFAGLFERIGKTQVEPDYFMKVNAPAIIFPFVREHIASLALKGSLNPILLEPVNFMSLAKKGKK